MDILRNWICVPQDIKNLGSFLVNNNVVLFIVKEVTRGVSASGDYSQDINRTGETLPRRRSALRLGKTKQSSAGGLPIAGRRHFYPTAVLGLRPLKRTQSDEGALVSHGPPL